MHILRDKPYVVELLCKAECYALKKEKKFYCKTDFFTGFFFYSLSYHHKRSWTVTTTSQLLSAFRLLK